MCLELFGRLFLDDVGAEPHSVLNEIGRFDVKEAKFRRDMEKLRNNHQKDLYIEEVCKIILSIKACEIVYHKTTISGISRILFNLVLCLCFPAIT